MFACTSCGAQMRFDPESGKLVCGFCNNRLSVSEHPDDSRFKEGNAAEAKHSGMDVTIFTCPQCGGEIMSMENQATEFCTFCGASVTLEGRLSEANYPKKILPFRIGKKKVQESYSDYLNSLHFVPSELKSPDYQEKFCGIYVPYWSYKVSQKGHAFLEGFRNKGNSTEYCDVSFDLDTEYDDIYFNAASSFDDTLADAITPFGATGTSDFSPAYLMGFYSDIPDVDSSIYEANARKEANTRTIGRIVQLDSDMIGMNFSNPDNLSDSRLNTKVEKSRPVMLPVWFLTWRSKGKRGDRVSYAVVNGENGTMKAEVPVDLKKCLLMAALFTIPLCILLFLCLPALMPETAMVLSGWALMLMMNLYERHMRDLLRREEHLDDFGYLSKKNPEKMSENREKKDGMKVFGIINYIWIIGLILMMLERRIFKNQSGFLTLVVRRLIYMAKENIPETMAVAMLPGIFSASIKLGEIHRNTPDKGTFLQSLVAYAALACAAVILFRHPVSDLFYYGGMLLIVGGMLVLLYGLLERFNFRCSHAIPNFLDRKETEE